MEETTEQENSRDEKGQFMPGVSGNPGGRPKNEDSPTYWLRKFLSEVDPKSPEGKKRIEDIAIRLATEAIRGEGWAMKEVFDRLDGQAPQTLIHEGGFFSESKLEIVTINPEDDEIETEPETNSGTPTA